MSARMVVLGAILVAVLPGCANLRESPPPHAMTKKDCTGQKDCECAVTVTCPAGQPCAAVAAWDIMELKGNAGRWQIKTAGYAFDAAKGIEFKTAEGQAAMNCGPVDHGDFHCTRKGKPDGKTYEYRINVTGPNPVPPADPFIVNN